jgi:DNA repair exonuclease SbcCD ATPase subunit
LTALSLQQNNSNFIDKTQGERKDLLANFLDLKIFDALYELANKENRTATIVLEEYQKQDFETKLGDAERSKDINETKHTKAQEDVDKAEEELQDLTDELLELNKQLQPCNADGLDINKLESQLQSANQKLLDLGELGSSYQLKLQDEQVVLGESETELNRYKESFDTELYKEYMAKVQQKVDLDNTLATLKVTIKNKLEKLEKLQQHEYDPNCKYCCDNVFVKDAIDTKQQLESDKETVHEFLGKLKEVSNFIEINGSIADQAEEIQKLVKQYGEAKASVDKYQSAYDKVKHEIATVKHNISNLQRDIQTYNANTQTLENNKKIQAEIKEVQTKVSTTM